MSMRSLEPHQLQERLIAEDELAVLDAREQGAFAAGHLFHASSTPVSHLELLLGDLVPRRSTPIVWCDADGSADGLAARAAARAGEMGWTDCSVLAGGLEGWAEAGGERYAGLNVASKALGQHLVRTSTVSHRTAPEVEELLAAARGQADVVVLDSRSPREVRKGSIPGAMACPGPELVHRIKEVAPDPGTVVVVSCGERPTSIIWAHSLIEAGLQNQVMVLENGIIGWEMAGLDPERDREVLAPEPGTPARAWARRAATAIGRRSGVRRLTIDEIDAWRADTGRTTYLLDVRTTTEFEAGHLEGSRSVPGGRLVGAPDEHVATGNARLLLIDDDEVRATVTGSWMRRLGWGEVGVLAGGLTALAGTGILLQTGPRARVPVERVPTMKVSELARRLAHEPEGVTVLDVGTSIKYRRQGHIPRAWWGVRSRLDEARAAIGPVATLVVTSSDGQLAKLAVPEAAALWPEAAVLALAGGNKGWRHGGHTMEAGSERATTEVDDRWYGPYDHGDTGEALARRLRDHLRREIGVLDRIERDPTIVRLGAKGSSE